MTFESYVFTCTKQDGASPLIMASQNGHKEIVELLLAANADVNFHYTKVIYLFVSSFLHNSSPIFYLCNINESV